MLGRHPRFQVDEIRSGQHGDREVQFRHFLMKPEYFLGGFLLSYADKQSSLFVNFDSASDLHPVERRLILPVADVVLNSLAKSTRIIRSAYHVARAGQSDKTGYFLHPEDRPVIGTYMPGNLGSEIDSAAAQREKGVSNIIVMDRRWAVADTAGVQE